MACPSLHGRCAAELRREYLSTDPKLSVPPYPLMTFYSTPSMCGAGGRVPEGVQR